MCDTCHLVSVQPLFLSLPRLELLGKTYSLMPQMEFIHKDLKIQSQGAFFRDFTSLDWIGKWKCTPVSDLCICGTREYGSGSFKWTDRTGEMYLCLLISRSSYSNSILTTVLFHHRSIRWFDILFEPSTTSQVVIPMVTLSLNWSVWSRPRSLVTTRTLCGAIGCKWSWWCDDNFPRIKLA